MFKINPDSLSDAAGPLAQRYQRELNRCIAREWGTGSPIRAHHPYLKIIAIRLPAAMGFSTPVLAPRFMLITLPSQTETVLHRITSTIDHEIATSKYPSLDPSSPWFSLLENECRRAGPPHLVQQMTAIRNGIPCPYLREWLGLAGFDHLAKGRDISLFFDFLNTPDVAENQLRHWNQLNPEASQLIEDYLFFAFYNQWREYR